MKKLEIHVFPGKTSGVKSYKISLRRAIVTVVLVAIAVIGFIIFAPSEVVDHVSDKNVISVYRQNNIIKKEIKEIRQSVDESILKAEETKLLRDSTIKIGGLGFMLEEGSDRVASDAPRKSLTEIEATFRGLLAKIETDSALAATAPVIHPLKNNHAIKNRFEMIYDPFTEQTLPHTGIDYVAITGDTVYATGAGYVNDVMRLRGFGLSIKIDHRQKISTFYAHLGEVLVQPGSKVRRGQPIALIGESGTESSVSLHYEIRVDGTPVNPEDYFITK